jgi:putative transposase
MIKAIKIKLYPNQKQEILMWKSAGISRFSYNWGLNYLNSYYKENNKVLFVGELRKIFTQLRNSDIYPWLREVSSDIPQQALKDLNDAFVDFSKGIHGHPKFKKKNKSEISFFHLGNKFIVKDKLIRLEKIGFVKMNDENRLVIGNYKKDKIKVTNPRIKYNGRYWYLSLGIEIADNDKFNNVELSIGVDLGIKDLAIVSNIDKPFKNINKSKKVKKLNKKLKKLKRRCSRKYEMNLGNKDKQGISKSGKVYVKTKNIIKLEKKIRLLYKKIANIRLNHIHQITNTIVKTKPSRIVVEDLNVVGMMKNKHLSRAIQEQCFNKFTNILKYKSEWNNIEFVKADRFYPSSKKCSCCGLIKKDLKLKDRVYKCKCGFILDRDKNASINLANYKLVV